ncbi:YggT family protein [Maricaulis salignorans]|uniref:YggT family protein n=1 Tax=Maricaulis salignorans TaxID=144026 RepID=A0A1G9SXM1_9PROT|nr:YggT family protein [Maricaulis salignorans]SDM40173.1 YggT family protein [Maricaulis salignorans]
MPLELSFGQALVVYFLNPILGLLWIIVIVGVILSWLISFNVVNPHNQFVGMIWRLTNSITEPLLGPIRSILPNLGGMDFSPVVLLLLISFAQGYVVPMLMRVL